MKPNKMTLKQQVEFYQEQLYVMSQRANNLDIRNEHYSTENLRLKSEIEWLKKVISKLVGD